jgi:CDP-glucose 4,6-dehydratase
MGIDVSLFKSIYNNKRVLVTGHTGFKGSWLVLWLLQLGAKVVGYSQSVLQEPNHYNKLGLDIKSIIGDIRDGEKVNRVFREEQPEIVFHLAAQSLVRHSFKDPVETFTTNVIGTVNVFEAARRANSVQAIINVTSDKCYKNNEWQWGYREIDAIGGHDPYSASKGCSELITNCWRNSFFNTNTYTNPHGTLICSARAGNVIGGGDWAADRIIPDIIRAVSRNEKVKIRNPKAARPWQHVLEPLSGYLLLGQKLLEGNTEYADSWNFGPSEDGHVVVENIVAQAQKAWPTIQYELDITTGHPHETTLLKLDCSKARDRLGWHPVWNHNIAIEKTINWYKRFYESNEVLSWVDLNCYIQDACDKNIEWACK